MPPHQSIWENKWCRQTVATTQKMRIEQFKLIVDRRSLSYANGAIDNTHSMIRLHNPRIEWEVGA